MNPHFESLGWTLIHFCWQAAAIAIAYKVADSLLTTTRTLVRSQTRYLLALATMLTMFAAALATLSYEELRLQHAAAVAPTPVQPLIDNMLATFANAPAAIDAATPAISHRFNPAAAMPWLDALWMLGVLALSLRTVGGWWVIQHLRRSAVPNIPPDLAATFIRLSRRIGLTRSVDLRLSAHIASPVAIGIFRSIVLLPISALTTLSPEQLEAVLAHELAHIRRADYLWNILQTMIETLFFFHPAVWWVGRNLRQQRELCCDDVAIASCSDPLTYATALLALEEQRSLQPRLAMALDGNQPRFTLRSRIARILGESQQPTHSGAAFSLAGVCGALVLLLLPLPQLYASLRHNTLNQISATPIPTTYPASGKPGPASAPSPASAPAPISKPQITVAVISTPTPHPTPDTPFDVQTSTNTTADSKAQASSSKPVGSGSDYITRMRAAGYDTDLDHYIGMKTQGVTPDFAQQMSQLGYGKPTVDQLIALKIHGATPEYVAKLNADGLKPGCFDDLISYRIFNVTPEYVTAMKAAGFSDIPAKKLVELRVHNVTPEFARTAKQQFPDVTVQELTELRIFRIDDAFIARAKQLGLTPLTIRKLVQLRISGLLDDERVTN